MARGRKPSCTTSPIKPAIANNLHRMLSSMPVETYTAPQALGEPREGDVSSRLAPLGNLRFYMPSVRARTASGLQGIWCSIRGICTALQPVAEHMPKAPYSRLLSSTQRVRTERRCISKIGGTTPFDGSTTVHGENVPLPDRFEGYFY